MKRTWALFPSQAFLDTGSEHFQARSRIRLASDCKSLFACGWMPIQRPRERADGPKRAGCVPLSGGGKT
jgi:hypothetical protein